MNYGYVKIWRKIWKFFERFKEPYDRRSAWTDLILLARGVDGEVKIKGKSYRLKRGQFIASYSFLAKRWKWTEKRVIHFLFYLENEQMIVKDIVTPDGRVWVIANYEEYQPLT